MLEEEGGAGAEAAKKELHSRLRFDRRGILAVAKPLDEDNELGDDLSFFISLDRCSDLDGQHTIFGTVVGEGIYAVAQIGETQVDEHDRPLECPKILEVAIVESPFDDLDVEGLQKAHEKELLDDRKAIERARALREKRKRKKDACLLSFGEEAEEEEMEAKQQKDLKIKSTHEIMRGTNAAPAKDPTVSKAPRGRKELDQSDRNQPSLPRLSKAVASTGERKGQEEGTLVEYLEQPEASSFGEQKGTGATTTDDDLVNSARQDLHNLRAKYFSRRKEGQGQDEGETLRKLNAFCAKLRGSPVRLDKATLSTGDRPAKARESGQTTWAGNLRSHRLKFGSTQEDLFAPEDYVVIDPHKQADNKETSEKLGEAS